MKVYFIILMMLVVHSHAGKQNLNGVEKGLSTDIGDTIDCFRNIDLICGQYREFFYRVRGTKELKVLSNLTNSPQSDDEIYSIIIKKLTKQKPDEVGKYELLGWNVIFTEIQMTNVGENAGQTEKTERNNDLSKTQKNDTFIELCQNGSGIENALKHNLSLNGENFYLLNEGLDAMASAIERMNKFKVEQVEKKSSNRNVGGCFSCMADLLGRLLRKKIE